MNDLALTMKRLRWIENRPGLGSGFSLLPSLHPFHRCVPSMYLAVDSPKDPLFCWLLDRCQPFG